MATGCLSLPKAPDIDGRRPVRAATCTSRAAGRTRASTSPASASASSAPARRASSRSRSSPSRPPQLTVFQRTPNFSIPARNGPLPEERRKHFDADPRRVPRRGQVVARRRADARAERDQRARTCRDEERRRAFEAACGRRASCSRSSAPFADMPDQRRGQRDGRRVHARQDPLDRRRSRDRRDAVPEGPLLRHQADRASTPTTTRRSTCPHVRLVDLRKTPITTITETGIDTIDGDRSSSTPSSTPPASTR